MNLETKITMYKFTPQLFTLTPYSLNSQCDEWVENRVFSPFIFYSYLPSST